MSNTSDFIIKNGVLTKYVGPSGDVVIPNGVTEIGAKAFECRKDITRIIISEGVTCIKKYAFAFCTKIVSVLIPNSVTSIGDGVFEGCSSITSIVIPDSVVEMGWSVFRGCSLLKTISLSNNLKIMNPDLFACCSALERITLPDSVVEIKGSVFRGCTSLTSIIIPPLVKEIDLSMFVGCENLCSITLPEGIEHIIKPKGFGCHIRSCTSLNHLNCINANDKIRKLFWQGLGKEKKEAFSLAYLEGEDTMPTYVKQYITANLQRFVTLAIQQKNASVFTKLIYLKKQLSIDEIDALIPICEENNEMLAILLNYKNKLYPTEDIDAHETDAIEKELGFKEKTLTDWRKAYQLKISEDTITINKYKGEDTEIVIPEIIDGKTVVAIGPGAFAAKPIISVVIPNCIKTIGTGAFRNCTALISFTLPKNITALADGIFKNCSSLATVELPETITSIGAEAFRGCTALTQCCIPKHVTEIGVCAFLNCKSLTSSIIPNTVSVLNSGLFDGCSALSDISLPDNIEEIECNFYDTALIKNNKYFKEGALCIGKHLIDARQISVNNYRIPDGIRTIHQCCFLGNETLENVFIPDSVTKICNFAFAGCKNLKSASIPASVTEISHDAFESSVTIHAPAGSYAETYAKENNIPFVAE